MIESQISSTQLPNQLNEIKNLLQERLEVRRKEETSQEIIELFLTIYKQKLGYDNFDLTKDGKSIFTQQLISTVDTYFSQIFAGIIPMEEHESAKAFLNQKTFSLE